MLGNVKWIIKYLKVKCQSVQNVVNGLEIEIKIKKRKSNFIKMLKIFYDL